MVWRVAVLVLLLATLGETQNASHNFDASDAIVWEPEGGLVGGYYEDVSFVITAEEVKTLEVVLLVENMPHAVSLYVRSSNDEEDKADLRIHSHARCNDFVDECRQQQLFQYTQPSFLKGHSDRYTSRLAVRVQPTYPTESLSGRWTISIANDLGDNSPNTIRVKLLVWQQTYGYWDVVAVVILLCIATMAALVAMWDYVSSIGSQTRVLRPAEEGRVVRRQIESVYRQLSDATSLIRETPGGGGGEGGQTEAVSQDETRRVRRQWYKTILVGSLLMMFVMEFALLAAGYAFKAVVGALTLDLSNIRWEVDMYHHLVGLTIILAYLTHIELFAGALKTLIPAKHAAWRHVVLFFSLLLEVLMGYLAHFILWSLNSTVWEWQVHYCKGYAMVLLYGTLVHNLMVLTYERWRSQYVVEHVIEPPGKGKESTASSEDEITLQGVATPVGVEAPTEPVLETVQVDIDGAMEVQQTVPPPPPLS